MKTIVLTGGGTAGHVSGNIALVPKLRELGWSVQYVGSESGIEKQIIERHGGIPYHGIASGKLRRYFDWNNFKDPFRVVQGVFQAYRTIKRLKPDVVFSKGGFVTVPVIVAAWMNRVPIIIHESDYTPGLANKISMPFASKICVTFPETMQFISSGKAVRTGPPIRDHILRGSRQKGLHLCDFVSGRPVVMIMGGSQGSSKINDAVRQNLQTLLERFQIIHICGKGNGDDTLRGKRGYKQFEYVHDELSDLLAATDFVISRAGSNSIFEFLELRKPMLLIPLSRQASRGDQILNAESFEKQGYCRILYEEHLNPESFLQSVMSAYENRQLMIDAMKQNENESSVDKIIRFIEQDSHSKG